MTSWNSSERPTDVSVQATRRLVRSWAEGVVLGAGDTNRFTYMSLRPLRLATADPVVHAVGARPDFVKMAPLIQALDQRGVADRVVVLTGQHDERRMSQEILEDLGFRASDSSLGVSSGSHGEQTSKVLIAFEEILMSTMPAVVVVADDVKSRPACPLAAPKPGIPIVHLESGLRSGDSTMPGGAQPLPDRPPFRLADDPQPRGENHDRLASSI
jgi:hypothetical protein